MRWMPVHHEKVKVPVIKNILYATKILYKANKSYMIWHIVDQFVYTLFINFFQTVLFLRVLLNIIEGNADFSYYLKTLLLFFIIGIVYEFLSVFSDYKSLVGEKKMFKALNNMIFEKAAQVDISCYEDPAFYDKYQRAIEIVQNSYFFSFAISLAQIIGNLAAFFSVMGIVM